MRQTSDWKTEVREVGFLLVLALAAMRRQFVPKLISVSPKEVETCDLAGRQNAGTEIAT
jgi:hypothetical protein